jgi:broad specificity phosphatase PhoE
MNRVETKEISPDDDAQYATPNKSKKTRRRVDGSPIIARNPNLPVKIIYLIRHGQSLGQTAKMNGWNRNTDSRLLDCGLTKKGESEAVGVPKLFSHEQYESIELVVSSPLTRAVTTALLGFPQKNILLNYDLREIGSRVPENQPRAIENVINDLKHLVGSRTDGLMLDVTSLKPPNWPRDLSPNVLKRDRIRKVFQYLYRERQETNIAVCCHYNVIRSAIVDGPELRPENAMPIRCVLFSNGDVVLANKS